MGQVIGYELLCDAQGLAKVDVLLTYPGASTTRREQHFQAQCLRAMSSPQSVQLLSRFGPRPVDWDLIGAKLADW